MSSDSMLAAQAITFVGYVRIYMHQVILSIQRARFPTF